MRGVGQLALHSTDPGRTAEFYESAFGFKRRAADDGGVDLELGGFELSFRRAERAARDGMQIGFRVDTGNIIRRRIEAGARVLHVGGRRHLNSSPCVSADYR